MEFQPQRESLGFAKALRARYGESPRCQRVLANDRRKPAMQSRSSKLRSTLRLPAASALIGFERRSVLARSLELEGIAWFEEPIRHDDLAGNARIAAAGTIPLQLGENFNGVEAMAAAILAAACHLVMPDLARIGGVTGWMHAAGLAAAHGIPMSSHLFPEVSAHLNADCTLAGVCRLGGIDHSRAAACRRRYGDCAGPAGNRNGMGGTGHRALSDDLTYRVGHTLRRRNRNQEDDLHG